jgi:endonuclease-3
MRTLCVGEALVDLVCERPVASPADAEAFLPRLGGAAAAVAITAARRGGDVALAAGAGDDAWGRWLLERVAAEGVATDHIMLDPARATPVAFVTLDADGRRTTQPYGPDPAAGILGLGDGLLDAVGAADALFFTSATLVGDAERALTLRAREHARALGRPILLSPDLRADRWRSTSAAVEVVGACVPGAFLVVADEREALALTGELDVDAAAASLLAAGAQHVVVTLGEDGAFLRGGGVDREVRGGGRPARRARPHRLLPRRAGRDAARRRGGGRPRRRGRRPAGVSAPAPATVARDAWVAPTRARVARVRERLRDVYGVPCAPPHEDPLAELVLTVLSQSTNDRNRDVAFLRLRERFASWEAVRDAPVALVEEAIRPGGISKVKSARIVAILAAIDDDNPGGEGLDLGWMRDAPVARSRDFLCALPGVGRKTAACVLLFAYGLRDVPVDTHVSRVGMRLHLLRPGAPFEELHDAMLALTPPGAELELHVNLLRHGRRTCHAQRPACPDCPLRRMCPSRDLA